jgi:hypothetical protein
VNTLALNEPQEEISRQRRFEIARAWKVHEPLRAAVPYAAKQRARALIDTIANERPISDVPSKVLSPIFRDFFRAAKNDSRQRAVARLKRLLPHASVRQHGAAIVIKSMWAYGPNVDDPIPVTPKRR